MPAVWKQSAISVAVALILTSCQAARSRQAVSPPPFLAGQDLQGHAETFEARVAVDPRSIEALRDGEAWLNADTNHDGVPDRLDWDLDGDGVPNLADSHPFDPIRGREDVDTDGLPDFIDYEVNGLLKDGATKEAARLQQEIAVKLGILVGSEGVPFSADELRFFRDELTKGAIASFRSLDTLKLVIKRPLGDSFLDGQFHPFWKTITIRGDFAKSSERKVQASLIHEYFHAIASQFPDKFASFCAKVGWTQVDREGERVYVFRSGGLSFELADSELEYELPDSVSKIDLDLFPSDYAKAGCDEMFAEVGAATVLLADVPRAQWSRVGGGAYHLERFRGSLSHQAMLEFLHGTR